eukprot:1188872-Prorocentrum_minimum.AAC.2
MRGHAAGGLPVRELAHDRLPDPLGPRRDAFDQRGRGEVLLVVCAGPIGIAETGHLSLHREAAPQDTRIPEGDQTNGPA